MSAEEAYKVVAKFAGQLFPGVAGALGIISPPHDEVDLLAQWGDPAVHKQPFAPEDCWALRSGRPYLAGSTSTRLMCKHVTPAECLSTFCVPMMALGESLGILFMSSSKPGCNNPLGPDAAQHNLAVAFAENLSLALANLRLRETLRLQSMRDPLTALFNRRYMEEFFDLEVKRAARSQRPIGVILFDLDHFKHCNDTFGHEAGDVLLKEAAVMFGTLVRGEDIACRYGGEEFLLLMPHASLEVTRLRAESLRSAMEGLHLEYRGQLLGTITTSLGVAIFPEHGETAAAVLRAADLALYRAKHSGRNCVVLAEQASDIASTEEVVRRPFR